MASLAHSHPASASDDSTPQHATLESERSPVFIRAATLISRDAERLADFYVHKLGFERVAGNSSMIELGAGGTAFLRLENHPNATPFDPAASGLFHIAYLLPSRADLARWFLSARAAGVAFDGASDHAVSEAFYLTDPDGNGIEVYADRKREEWPRDAKGYAMTTGPMALREMIAHVETASETAHLPAATRIGHIHLQMGDAERAAQFWQENFGLEETHRRPGVRFLSWGGYHHHVAINNWRSRGSGPRAVGSAGLSAVEFAVREEVSTTMLAGQSSLDVREPGGIQLSFQPAQSTISAHRTCARR
ncbi:MAG: VOC family protein [Rhabdaerophilum sp.]